MSIIAFIQKMKGLGIEFLIVDGELKVKAGKGVLTPELIAELKERKSDVQAFLGRSSGQDQLNIPSIDEEGGKRVIPLSFAQERLWFLAQLEPESAAYNIFAALKLTGKLDIDVLSRAFSSIIERHEVFRYQFVTIDGNPSIELLSPYTLSLAPESLDGATAAEKEAAFEECLSQEAQYCFSLNGEKLLRIRLFEIAEQDYRLTLNIHHIISDGWSLGLIVKELSHAYAKFAGAGNTELPPLNIQYGDYAAWLRREAQKPDSQKGLDFWLDNLKGSVPLELPPDFNRSKKGKFKSLASEVRLSETLTTRLNQVASAHNSSLFMFILAGMNVLMSRLTGQQDFCIGAPVANRPNADCEQLIGMFMNTVVFRMQVDGDESLVNQLQKVKQTTLDAYAHQDVPFERIVDGLGIERDTGRTPIFQIFVNMLNFPFHELDMAGVGIEICEVPDVASKFDLTFYFAEESGETKIQLMYNAELYTPERIDLFLAQFKSILEQVCDNPEAPLGEYLLSTGSKSELLPDPCLMIEPFSGETVCARFDRSVRDYSERTAVIDFEQSYTYLELDVKISALCALLLKQGVNCGDVIAIYAGRDAGLVIAMMAILRVGGKFVVLDPKYPPLRLSEIVSAAKPKGFISTREVEFPQSMLADAGDVLFHIDVTELNVVSGQSDPSQSPGIELDMPAYLAFTSGTTGKPKGMTGTHRPLAHFIDWHVKTHGFREGDRFSMISGLAHDPLLRDILTPLAIGATLCIPDEDTVLDGTLLAKWFCDQKITVTHLTPAMSQFMTEAVEDNSNQTLRYAFFGGDRLHKHHVDSLLRWAPSVSQVNFYGATETPQAMSAYRVDYEDNRQIPLGVGIEGVQLLVVNNAGQLAAIGELGEIWVRTPYLTKGYINQDDESSERFISNPWNENDSAHIYKTGDLGRYGLDGFVEYLGRRDSQVKIRGFRVELSEIDIALSRHADIQAAVSQVAQLDSDQRHLISYVVTVDGKSLPDAAELRRFLMDQLPDYMIPVGYFALGEIPLTPNGKIDYQRLPIPEKIERASQPYEPPAGDTEIQVARIWSELLNVEKVGRHDDFFELGGHSLLVTRVISRLASQFDLQLAVRDMFDATTVSCLAERIETMQWMKQPTRDSHDEMDDEDFDEGEI